MGWRGCKLELAQAQTIEPGAVEKLSGYNVVWASDGDTFYDPAEPTKLRIPADVTPTLAVVSFQLSLVQASGGTRRFAAVYKNGITRDLPGHHHRPGTSAAGGGADMPGGTTLDVLTGGDFFELVILQDSGLNVGAIQLDYNTHLAVGWWI